MASESLALGNFYVTYILSEVPIYLEKFINQLLSLIAIKRKGLLSCMMRQWLLFSAGLLVGQTFYLVVYVVEGKSDKRELPFI